MPTGLDAMVMEEGAFPPACVAVPDPVDAVLARVQGGELEAQGLSPSGRHEGHDVLPGHEGVDDLEKRAAREAVKKNLAARPGLPFSAAGNRARF